MKYTKNGFNNVDVVKNVKVLTISRACDSFHIDDKKNELFIKRNIAQDLSKSLIENDLIIFNIYEEWFNNQKIIQGTINVVDPGIRYVNKKDEKFVVDDQVFDNDELIEAVRKTFPERFI